MASTTSLISSVSPLCPGCPPGFLPDGLRKDFVRRISSSFRDSLDGGVLLLPEFFGGSSYLERRLRSSSISLSFFSRRRFRSRISPELPLAYSVNLTDSRMLGIDGLLHRFNLCGQSAKHFCYVINLLFHSRKGTNLIGHTQIYLHLILIKINKLSDLSEA